MNRKKVIFLLVILSFLISLASTSVFAATTDYMPNILKEFFKWLFFTLPEQARSGDEAFVIYFKLILWLLMFPIIFFGANKIFPDSRRISSVIAGVFSLIAVIFIPKGVLIFIFTEFSAVTSLILALAPIFIGIFIRSKIPDDLPMLKNGIMIIVGVILIITGGYFTAAYLTGDNKLFEQFGVWASALGAVALVWGVFGFLFGFGLGKGGGEGTDSITDQKKKMEEEREKERKAGKTEKKIEKLEKKDIKKKLKKITAQSKKDSQRILKDLEALRSYVDEFGHDEKARKKAIEKIRDIPPKQHEIEEKINEVRQAEREVETLEKNFIGLLRQEIGKHENLKSGVTKEEMDAVEQKIREDMTLAKNKFKAENKIDELINFANNYNEKSKSILKSIVNALKSGRKDMAKQFIDQAIELEKRMDDIFDAMLKYEAYIQILTKDEIKVSVKLTKKAQTQLRKKEEELTLKRKDYFKL